MKSVFSYLPPSWGVHPHECGQPCEQHTGHNERPGVNEQESANVQEWQQQGSQEWTEHIESMRARSQRRIRAFQLSISYQLRHCTANR